MSDPIRNLFSLSRYPAPYSMFHDKPYKLPGSFVGPLGFPNQLEIGARKPLEETRIFVLGNSAVRSPHGEHSMPAHLEGILGGDAKVYNFGIESGNSWQGLMLLVGTLTELEPDIIVAYDGVTDLIVPLSYDPRPGYPYNQYLMDLLHEAAGQGKLSELNLLRAEGQRRAELRKEVDFLSAAWTDAVIDAYIAAIHRYCVICSAFGIRFAHVFQAVLGRKIAYPGTEARFEAVSSKYAALFDAALARRTPLEAKFPDRDRVRFGSATSLFQESSDECFSDYTHLHNWAQPVPAKYIASLLDGWVK